MVNHKKPRIYRGGDAACIGATEPEWLSHAEQAKWSAATRRQHIGSALNWYGQTQSKSTANDWVYDWLRKSPKREALALFVRKFDELNVNIGWLCRCHDMGLRLTLTEMKKIHTAISALVESKLAASADPEVKAKPRVTIADRVTEKVKQCRGEIEGQFDDFVINNCSGDPSIMGFLIQFNVPQTRVKDLISSYDSRLIEFKSALSGTDPYMVEAYSNFSRRQLRSVVRWLETAREQMQSYGTMKSANRKPRKTKSMTPEKMVSKLKYQRKLDTPAIDSIDPVLILKAEELWVYDAKKGRLGRYIADDTQSTLNIKNTKLLGFSVNNSVSKKLRKPIKQLDEFMKLGKPAAKKWFSSIKASELKMNGRINATTVLLKAYK